MADLSNLSEKEKDQLADLIKNRVENKQEDFRQNSSYYLPSEFDEEPKDNYDIYTVQYDFNCLGQFKILDKEITSKEIKKNRNEIFSTLIWTEAIREKYCKYIPVKKLGIDNIVRLVPGRDKTFEESGQALIKTINSLSDDSLKTQIIFFPSINLLEDIYDG